MLLESVNIGLPQNITWQGKEVFTGIFKYPVDNFVDINLEGIKGDGQAEKDFHGGDFKAIYGYASEYYDLWEQELGKKLETGIFGENLTISGGLFENEIHLGDTFQIGSVIIQATEPRIPCFKLNIRLEDELMVKKFLNSERSGVYFKVIQPGRFKKGDSIILKEKASHNFSIAKYNRLLTTDKNNKQLIEEALATEFLSLKIKEKLEEKLNV